MFISIYVGVLAGVIGGLCWTTAQFVLSLPAIYSRLGSNWYFVPPALALLAIFWGVVSARVTGIGRSSVERRSFTDAFESYHFGMFLLHSAHWFTRGLISALGIFLGGIFGVEGAVFEWSYATLPFLSRYVRLFIAERQTFVVCTMASSLAVAFGAPFTGGLMALELVSVVDPKMRFSAMLSTFVAYAVAHLFVSSGESLDRLNVIGSLFAGLRPFQEEPRRWILLMLLSVLVGATSGVGAKFVSDLYIRMTRSLRNLFGARIEVSALAAAFLMSVIVFLVPESFAEPYRMWQDLGWVRLSSIDAVVLLTARTALLILSFAVWGSFGVVTPLLVVGALIGYSIGLFAHSAWAVPLALVGCASFLGGIFRVPLSAIALMLELGRYGPTWWLVVLGVVSSHYAVKFLKGQALHAACLKEVSLKIVGGRVAQVLGKLTAGDAMYKDVTTIRDSATLGELRDAVLRAHHNFLGVISMDGSYLGMIALEQLPSQIRKVVGSSAATSQSALERVVEIRDLIDTGAPMTLPETRVDQVLELFEDAPCIAVVNAERRLEGFLFESTVAGRYKRELANTVIFN